MGYSRTINYLVLVISSISWGIGSAMILQVANAIPVIGGFIIGVASFVGGVALGFTRVGVKWGKMETELATIKNDLESTRVMINRELMSIREELAELVKIVAEMRGERNAENQFRQRRPR